MRCSFWHRRFLLGSKTPVPFRPVCFGFPMTVLACVIALSQPSIELEAEGGGGRKTTEGRGSWLNRKAVDVSA